MKRALVFGLLAVAGAFSSQEQIALEARENPAVKPEANKGAAAPPPPAGAAAAPAAVQPALRGKEGPVVQAAVAAPKGDAFGELLQAHKDAARTVFVDDLSALSTEQASLEGRIKANRLELADLTNVVATKTTELNKLTAEKKVKEEAMQALESAAAVVSAKMEKIKRQHYAEALAATSKTYQQVGSKIADKVTSLSQTSVAIDQTKAKADKEIADLQAKEVAAMKQAVGATNNVVNVVPGGSPANSPAAAPKKAF